MYKASQEGLIYGTFNYRNAIKRFRANLSNNPDAKGLRISIKPTGCNGYSYVLDYASDISSDDQVMTFSDVVVVDPESVELINGTEIDFIEEGFNQVFKFKNPNAAGECGCGESFNI